MKFTPIICIGLGMALGTAGCACRTNLPETSDRSPGALRPQAWVADPPADPPAAPPAKPTVAPLVESAPWRHYIVQRGDSLWEISGRQGVLDRSMLWPILYSENRDQVLDPDLIEIGQNLKYSPKMTARQMNDAVREARETPLYVPHTAPRKDLSILGD